jgi:hypothetical protein
MSPNPAPLPPPRSHVSGSDQAVSAPPRDPLALCPRHFTETTARPFLPRASDSTAGEGEAGNPRRGGAC